MRTILHLAIVGGLALGAVGLKVAADDRAARPSDPATAEDLGPLEAEFRQDVRPFLEAHCLKCHGPDEAEGDLDLSVFTSADAALKDLPRWELVLDQLEVDAMPPARTKPRPTAEARDAVAAWIGKARRLEAERNAGDPGPVPVRRLSNAEYDHTIRDLTGVDLRPTREFPVDPANEAGFDNSAESLAMSPALFKKYLDAARHVADHLVLKLDGLAFAPHPVLADTDRDKYCVRSIIDFYGRQNVEYADYFLAAWQFRHRAALGRPDATLDDFADGMGLSRKYLATIWATLAEESAPVGPIAVVKAMWEELPAPGEAGLGPAREGCGRMKEFVVGLRQRLVPEVKNLTARGIDDGTQPFVLWKNRQLAANRMRHADLSAIKLDDLGLEAPDSPEARRQYEESFGVFCRTFPDAFYVTERARIYLKKEDASNTGRLLSAGFHSMTGYFRDDGPLYELILDEAGRAELDRLWRDFDLVSDVPARQFSSYLWYERAESGFLRGEPQFDFVRAEDKDAASEAKMGRFSEEYLAKVRRLNASERALRAIEDQFRIFAESIRGVERDRHAAEPRHIEALQEIAGRAFRRPLSDDDRSGIADFYRRLREEDGLEHEDAVRDTLVSILMSPRFCYRVDLTAEGAGIRPLSDFDLASRLSYFLWASMPDEELLALASAGRLREPEVLVGQARRMLRDPRVRGLATEFGGNWLDFRRFEEHNSVDRQRFPSFDDELRRSMFEEPVRYLVDLIRNDRPATELLEGGHTFVDAALARHYGMPAPGEAADGWARVDDAGRYGRGGLMPMAVFLTKNSPGLRTSPVKRGYWVVKRLLGENIPPPPPDVPELPEDESDLGELTLRETLARHRADRACLGCHERFDAMGLSFEGYGPVGEARTLDLGGRAVDTTATFPGGHEGAGLEGLRAYLEQHRRGDFARNLCEKLLAYALGRTLIPSDDATVEAMLEKMDEDGGRFGALVEVIVESPQFLNKRNPGDQSE